MELWGGFECTVARVGDAFRNQFVETGHYKRLDDIAAAAELGLRVLRYPALWETISPDDPSECDWRWHDQRFAALSQHGIRPIVGLLHHGSGPKYTSLLDPNFPTLFAEHARRVCERYPWIDEFTPVNEPITTARFSALYGHWYPHQRDIGAFFRAVVNQCKGSLLAMRAIRTVNPAARLVQTEDLGRVWSTPRLAYQADFENERRWLGFDLLFGRVTPRHPLYTFLIDCGVPESDLALLGEGEAAPDIVGINYYPTSERFLDDDWRKYPTQCLGGNGRDRYADVEALRRNPAPGPLGLDHRLIEAWERYAKPIAITEVHLGCTREEQLRWLMQAWRAAKSCRDAGCDIKAVTLWSLAGAADWNSLLTERGGFYEPGAFDIRSPCLRRTALAVAAKSLSSSGDFNHPVIESAGWWTRSDRFYFSNMESHAADVPARPILILGNGGTLDDALSRICAQRGLNTITPAHIAGGPRDLATLSALMDRLQPWAVIDATGHVGLSEANGHSKNCFRIDSNETEVIASLCAERSIPAVTFSTDRVFDGASGRPYVESDLCRPHDACGRSRAEMERRVALVCPDALIIRTSVLFGPWDSANFAYGILRELSEGQVVDADAHTALSPTYVPDLIHACLDLLIDGETGVWHLVNDTNDVYVTLQHFARMLAKEFGLPWHTSATDRLDEIALNIGLKSERAWIMPTLASAIARFRDDGRRDWQSIAVAAE